VPSALHATSDPFVLVSSGVAAITSSLLWWVASSVRYKCQRLVDARRLTPYADDLSTPH